MGKGGYMAKAKTVKNLIKEFGYVDGIRLAFWLVKYNRLHLSGRPAFRGGVKKVYSLSLRREIYIRPETTDLILLLEFFAKDVCAGENREYQIEFEYNGKDINYILDCGANIGLFSLLYAKKYPDAKIIAIEPEPENYKVLLMNIKDNSRITAIQNGVWYKESGLKIIPRDTGAYGFMVQECVHEKAEVNGISINKLIKQYGFPSIDILKMDIEGSELEVITNDSSVWLKKTKIIILETHERIKPGSEKVIENKLCKSHFIEGKRNGENRVFYYAGD